MNQRRRVINTPTAANCSLIKDEIMYMQNSLSIINYSIYYALRYFILNGLDFKIGM